MARHHHPSHHHKNAADHFEQAAHHHRQASERHASGNDLDASYHAQIARGHALHGHEHANQASKTQAYQQGNAGDWNDDYYSRNGGSSRWNEDSDDESQDWPRSGMQSEETEDEDYSSPAHMAKSSMGKSSAKGRKRMPPSAAKGRGREGQQHRRSH